MAPSIDARKFGMSTMRFEALAATHPDVPMYTCVSCSSRQPEPMAVSGTSPPPPKTGSPTASPISRAAFAVRWPATSVDFTTFGRCSMSTSKVLQSPRCQPSLPGLVSYRKVMFAESWVMAASPVQRMIR